MPNQAVQRQRIRGQGADRVVRQVETLWLEEVGQGQEHGQER
jgi:hypothetical protein